jgi:hypothetical protein
MNKIKLLFATLTIALASVLTPVLIYSHSTLAVNFNPGGQACGGANGTLPGEGQASDCTPAGGTKTLPQIAAFIINIFSWIVGVVSVIMIIYGGFRYITSGGDSNSVTSAKNTILYAIIGLVIVALAQVIVNFVLDKTNTIGTSTSSIFLTD